jgi:hypothetical protein
MQKLPLAGWIIHLARGSFCIASAMLTFMSGYYLGADWKSMFIEHCSICSRKHSRIELLLPSAFPNYFPPGCSGLAAPGCFGLAAPGCFGLAAPGCFGLAAHRLHHGPSVDVFPHSGAAGEAGQEQVSTRNRPPRRRHAGGSLAGAGSCRSGLCGVPEPQPLRNVL